MSDDEVRERARRRLEQRRVRRGEEARETRSSRTRGAGAQGQRAGNPWARIVAFASAVVRTLGAPRLLIALVAVGVLVLIVVGVRGCVQGQADQQMHEGDPAQTQEVPVHSPIDQAALSAILGDTFTTQLLSAAQSSDDAAWIAANPQAYTVDGEAVRYKLLKLAAIEPEARSFVRAFPDAYPADKAGACDPVKPGEVPRLYQWDRRWGATVYSSTAFALTGCGPTVLSMVYQGLTGKNDLSPYDMGVKAQGGGYMATFDGTDSSFLMNAAPGLGLSCAPVPVDANSLRTALQGKAVVVCNVGPGDFTDNGHFFAITGLASDGQLIINDPYSAERSMRTWDIDRVLGQTKALWVYRLA